MIHPIRSALALFVLALVGGTALGQAEWAVEVLVPDTISIRMPTDEIAFGITRDAYPPEAFPARYPATAPSGGKLPVQVFSNAAGGWSLVLEVPDLAADRGQGALRADQILFRVDGGVWLRASASPRVIYSAAGPTEGWTDVEIEFQLELDGTESPGAFSIDTRLSALVDGRTP